MVSKEEKKAKKEAKKLEKLKAEAELRKKLKREELEREIAAQSKKRGALDKSWREMMVKIKEPVFRQEFEVMWHVFERTYDKKNYLIKYTMKLMDTADDQFQRTVASFCDTIDTMINKFLLDMEQMSKHNDLRTSKLLEAGRDEATQNMADHDTAETHLQLLLYHAHTTADALAWTTRGENLVKEDEDRNKYASDRENLRSYLENNYSRMWDEYKAVLKAYITETSDNLKRVRKLRRKENLMADIIASQGKKIANSDGLLRRLRTDLAAYESGTKQAVFRDRRNRHRDAFIRLKKTLVDACADDAKQMAKLVRSSDDTLDWLESARKQGEKILRLSALCRKFETQREKVMPFGTSDPCTLMESKVNLHQHSSDDSLVANAVASTGGLTKLWQRISKADLSRRALIREKMLLEEENALIIQKIEEYNENYINPQPQSQKCLCNKKSKADAPHPVAIDGVLEASKYNNYKGK